MPSTPATWIDLLDPDEPTLLAHVHADIHPRALEQLIAPSNESVPARPTLESHGDYVFGVFLAPAAVPEEDAVFLQEVDLVITRDSVVTVRKTPAGRPPLEPAVLREVCSRGAPAAGMIAFHLADEVAERYLDLLDALDDEIAELEDHLEEWPAERVRTRLAHLRRDVLTTRRTLAPTRDALRRVVDGRIDLEGEELLDRRIELHFADVYDKLMRATESLEYSRELIAAVRDYHQSQITATQNEVLKRLSVVASLLLVPTFIVGVYGQNFEHMP